ncbi:OmpW/AlkL family protein [Candidatus Aalborgicola defluviihabitans]|jgi:outer membrane protein|uniref:OmpW/AlkL family protein n=1 Tax=Candidatus Aalborgicola defluviihabitans TaxID=3386187 RepID=UPI001D2545CA|nr:outer membrane beta-barrel protein [Burkholderiales bacterium]MBK6570443.1 outer membrane beta-barrel protein [Burkholderiales bacterium]MBK7279441.1 outer membrane beta-barrel protein [Burkholderiales bacterium]MBK7312865.1 outer membrane beta-barrel protein [Burkholderiales bacterium]
MKNTHMKFLLIPALLACTFAAQAQSAGTMLIRVGATNITPNVTSDDLTAPSLVGTKSSIGSSSRLSGGITYMVDDHFAIDLPLAIPFQHDISGDGAIRGAGKIGDVKALPATLFAQWRFLDANATVRPYVGAGITYAAFYGARSTSTLTALTGGTPANPTTLSVDSKWAASFQLGATFQMSGGWFIDANYVYTPLRTRTTLSTGQTLDATLNPSAVSLAVGMKF